MTESAGPYHSLRVERIIEETSDARSIVLGIPPELRSLFAYRAGQFLTFGGVLEGHQWVRCYSLASCPDSEQEHKVTIKRVQDGKISNWFHDHVEVGQTLHVMKPAGLFCLATRETPLVLFGAGSGITPVVSLLKSALTTTRRRIQLFYANRDQESIIFRAELESLVAKFPDRLAVVHRLDEVEGFLDAASAREIIAANATADFYLCGPGTFMDVVEGALGAEAVGEERIFIERFIAQEVGGGEPAAPPVAGEDLGKLEVYLDGQTHEVPIGPEETILAACNRAGLDAPCACVEGYCGACMARVRQGNVEMKQNDGGLDKDQEEEGWVLTCQSVVHGAGARIEYPDAD